MRKDKLTAIQKRVLSALSGMEPAWTLTGGPALAGFHTCERETRDLDLFWHGREKLERLPQQVRERLEALGLDPRTLQTEPSFVRLQLSTPNRGEVVVLDLVADSSTLLEEPVSVELGGASILIDTLHEILVNKLCALLGRSELRDLQDVRAILDRGGDLERAIRDAPEKDGGFSGPTLAWVLRQLPVAELGSAVGLDPEEIHGLETFREKLVQRVLAASRPDRSG